MKLITALMFILLFQSCATRVVKWSHQCRKHSNGEACYKAGLKEYALIEEIKRLDQKEIKKNAANWFKAGCDLKHEESCEKLKVFGKYLK
ncbi:MAG: hypothetical protein CME70_12780 [Halobacteriovorax sp.]|nr:hypothetical protein [Halobacteriovorax sp.]|tara:strand:+ start:176810 stop:177079 length:270 start_codon:yes stop_codon:yes gene_type:complete